MNHQDTAYDRRPGVLSAISLIRCLFEVQALDVNAYSDSQIADALLEIRPEADDRWLSEAHISRAFEHLKRQNGRVTESESESEPERHGTLR